MNSKFCFLEIMLVLHFLAISAFRFTAEARHIRAQICVINAKTTPTGIKALV